MNVRVRVVVVAALAAAACGREPHARLEIAVEGPGSVVVTNGERRVCRSSCSFELNVPSDLTLEIVPREGAAVEHAVGPCETATRCAVRLDADMSQSVVFRWEPLPPVTRYSSRRLDADLYEKVFSGVVLTDLDGHGNAVGMGYPYPSGSSYPVRFDAAKGTFESLHGLLPGDEAVRANDDGLVATYFGYFWQDGKAWSSGGKPVSDLSDHGWLVGSIQEMDTPTRPWVYDGTTLKIWGGGTPDVFASAVNSAGRVVGSQLLDAGLAIGSAKVAWSVEILPDSVVLLPIGEPSFAADVSDTGIVVGGLRSFGLARAAYVYDLETGSFRVVEPPEECISAELSRIDPSGSVAVGWGFCDWGGDTPLVYFVAEDRLVPLEYLVELPPGWYLRFAKAVNARGQILAGGGVLGGEQGLGETGYFILTPE